MKRMLFLICSSAFLGGCAGIGSDFEFSKPAKDSGYWLQQADDMTSNSGLKSPDSPVVSHIDISQYKLLNTGNIRLPVKTITQAPIFSTAKNVEENAEDGAKKDLPNNDMFSYFNSCGSKYCYPEPNTPFRKNETVSRLWIAPYVSPDNNAHLGEVLYFIAKKPNWLGMEK